jgi:hypothetical protein
VNFSRATILVTNLPSSGRSYVSPEVQFLLVSWFCRPSLCWVHFVSLVIWLNSEEIAIKFQWVRSGAECWHVPTDVTPTPELDGSEVVDQPPEWSEGSSIVRCLYMMREAGLCSVLGASMCCCLCWIVKSCHALAVAYKRRENGTRKSTNCYVLRLINTR